MMACVSIMGLSVIMWTLIGYSLAFGGNHGGILGDFRWAALNGVGWEAGPYSDTIPHLVFAAFQMMFAMITPALITGAVVGRIKFKALFAFIAFWSVIVYYPMAHMVWGEGGFLASIGSVDFAGGNVVHISSGVSALVLAIYLGRRKGYEQTSYRIHNIPFVALGAALLLVRMVWLQCGSALAADGLAAHAFMTTFDLSGSSSPFLDADRHAQDRKADSRGCLHRSGRWTRRNHARSRICPRLVLFYYRRACQPDLLFYNAPCKT